MDFHAWALVWSGVVRAVRPLARSGGLAERCKTAAGRRALVQLRCTGVASLLLGFAGIAHTVVHPAHSIAGNLGWAFAGALSDFSIPSSAGLALLLGLVVLRSAFGVSQASRLRGAPGTRLTRLTEFVFSQKTQERVFLPILADLRVEYFAALASQRIWKARWVRVRGYVGFWRAVGLHGIVKLALDVLRAVKGAS